MPRFKKGSVEAKRYMASIRKKKATTKKAVTKIGAVKRSKTPMQYKGFTINFINGEYRADAYGGDQITDKNLQKLKQKINQHLNPKKTKKAIGNKPMKKAVSKSTHKDTKSHNVNIRVVSGIDINQSSLDELARLIKINKSHTAYIKHLKDAPDRDPNLLKVQVARVKDAIASNKKRITDLKKLIK